MPIANYKKTLLDFNISFLIWFSQMGRKANNQKNIKSIIIVIDNKQIKIDLDDAEKIKNHEDLKQLMKNEAEEVPAKIKRKRLPKKMKEEDSSNLQIETNNDISPDIDNNISPDIDNENDYNNIDPMVNDIFSNDYIAMNETYDDYYFEQDDDTCIDFERFLYF